MQFFILPTKISYINNETMKICLSFYIEHYMREIYNKKYIFFYIQLE